MKVVQLLIDGFHPDFTSELFDVQHTRDLYDGFIKIDSKFPRLKRLNSPYMWGRTLAGPDFPKTLSGYNPNHTNLQSAEDQGYMTIDPKNWIWNQLAARGVTSFSFPYYLIEAIPTETIVGDNSRWSDLITIYNRNYTDKTYRLIDSEADSIVDASSQIYHAICDNFDYNYSLTKDEIKWMRDTWKNYSPETQSEFDSMIAMVREKLISKVLSDLKTNRSIILDEIYHEMIAHRGDNPNFYAFLGFVESDAIEHYARPYAEAFDYFRSIINDLIDKIESDIAPDILIVHGDHNMVTSEHLDKPFMAEFDLDGQHYHTNKAGYNHFPMYCDHGNRVGGYVFYRSPDLAPIVQELHDDGTLVIDRIRDWILNKVYPIGGKSDA